MDCVIIDGHLDKKHNSMEPCCLETWIDLEFTQFRRMTWFGLHDHWLESWDLTFISVCTSFILGSKTGQQLCHLIASIGKNWSIYVYVNSVLPSSVQSGTQELTQSTSVWICGCALLLLMVLHVNVIMLWESAPPTLCNASSVCNHAHSSEICYVITDTVMCWFCILHCNHC